MASLFSKHYTISKYLLSNMALCDWQRIKVALKPCYKLFTESCAAVTPQLSKPMPFKTTLLYLQHGTFTAKTVSCTSLGRAAQEKSPQPSLVAAVWRANQWVNSLSAPSVLKSSCSVQ